MTFISKTINFFKTLKDRKKIERYLEEEIRFHIETETGENIQKGMSPREARKAALQAFGGELKTKEECRESWGIKLVDEIGSDLRFGCDNFSKTKSRI